MENVFKITVVKRNGEIIVEHIKESSKIKSVADAAIHTIETHLTQCGVISKIEENTFKKEEN